MRVARRLAVCCSVILLVPSAQAVESESSKIEFFERKIRPVLVKHCYECHSSDADLIQGGLRVDDAGAMKRGGDSGAVVSPGEPDSSLIVAALRYDGMEMPPDQPLPEKVIRDFEKWIRGGAAMPEPAHPADASMEEASQPTIDWEKAKAFWAFQPPSLHAPEEIETATPLDTSWAQSKLDQFVIRRLALNELAPNSAASDEVWLRRVTFDLVGLPPTIEEVAAFKADTRPGAKQRVVDRLLSSSRHAERWARVWLDVARYAEDQAHIVGNNDSLTYPNAYIYRDWVIGALAADMPYNEFVKLQLAADLIAPDDPEAHIALGFIGLGPKYYRRGDLEVMADEWEDRIDTVTRGLLGLTVACARCHDHKYDPIPTSDYYALAGVFASTEMFNRPLNESVEKKGDQAKKPQDAVHIVKEGTPKDLQVMIRGDVKRLGPEIKRGFLTVIDQPDVTGFDSGSGRVALAEAITRQSNPLAARVIVNRVWRELMGASIVATPSNFGALGAQPSHPLLLDDLAVRFMNSGWSLKWLQREIVLSSTYAQSSHVDPAKAQRDPDNQLLWRMPRRRLSLESYRDSILAVSGMMDSAVGGPSIDPQDPSASRRTVYSKVSRLDLNPMLARFDFPDPNAHSPARHETTTPLQKLFLLNSPFLVDQSERLAERLMESGSSNEERIAFAYQLLFGREPSGEELSLASDFVSWHGSTDLRDVTVGTATLTVGTDWHKRY